VRRLDISCARTALSTAFLGHAKSTSVLGLSTDTQNGEKEKDIRDYLQRCSRTSGSVNVNQATTMPWFETNNEKLVQLFTQYGVT
jgi:hypothetical protein